MYQIEIKTKVNNSKFELWQHILNKPKDILYPIKYSNFIDCNTNKKFMIEKAMNYFNISYHQIKFTKEIDNALEN